MKLISTILVLFFFHNCKGQMPDYYVFLVKGEASVSKPGGKSELLKQQHFIYKDQLITLKKDAELTIADREQNFFVLRVPGIYNAKDLARQKSGHTPGITQKYLKLVWNELFNPNHDFTKFTKENIAGVYGGVSRGDVCNNLIFPVNNLKTSEDSLLFIWHQTSPKSKYNFIIYNNERKEVVNRAVKDTQVTLHIINVLNSVPGNYYWLVKGENGGCEDEVPVYFELMSRENEQKLIASILTGKANTDLPYQLHVIDKLEKNVLIPAAIRNYSALVEAHPGNEALLKSYVAFLLKYGHEEKANGMWQKMIEKK